MNGDKNPNNDAYHLTGDANDKQDGFIYARINGHIIYQFNNANAHSYFLAIPEEHHDAYQLFVGFPNKDFQYTSKKDIISQIDDIKKMISVMNKDTIYVLPDIPLNKLDEAAKENDNKKFNELLTKNIQPILADVYLQIKKYDNANKTIDQLIYFVKQKESDTKFIQWLEINLPNFIYGISYDDIKRYYYQNVSQDNDLGDTMVIPTDEIARINEQENVLEKNNSKKRVLTKPDINNYGFGNIFKITILLCISIGISIFISKILFK